MHDEIFEAALSGLIHDSGKILQRASVTPTKRHESMVDENVTVHATWTNAFVEQINPNYRKYARPGVYHHQPDNPDVADNETVLRVAIADKLSASERFEDDQQEKGSFPQHMVSIFDHIDLSGIIDQNKAYHYLPLKPLSLQESVIFPQEPGGKPQNDYEVLANALIDEARKEIKNREVYLENLLAAFQKYTWCLPSAYYYNLPDVSLYDHARSTAALAVCLTDFDLEKLRAMQAALLKQFKTRDSSDTQLDETVALLVGGDISGIQDFIYTITAKEAARTLRGRSFYIQLLTEALLRYLLRELDLPYTNVIYASGGHFFLLAPPSAATRLQEIQRELSEKLYHFHGTSLYLALSWVGVPMKGFSAAQFPEYWSQMHQHLQIKKQRRYAEVDDDLLREIFTPNPHGGNQEQLCSVCGREHHKVGIITDAETSGDEIKICAMCRSFADQIGKELPQAQQIYLGFMAPQETSPDSAMDVLKGFGMQVGFNQEDIKDPVDARATWRIDDEGMPIEDSQSAIWQRYVVNELPLGKTFDQLQKSAEGIKRLGVLRMDIDHLGRIFKEGLKNKEGKPIGSLARMSMLSFQVSLFFEGWLKKIIQQDKYQQLIYAVYSGGDDLFLVGPWNLMPALAIDIMQNLEKFVSHNPDIRLSGGLAFIHGKYPIHEAARDAGNAEARSKSAGRNRFTFLDVTSTWQTFLEIQNKCERLNEIIAEGGARSLLQLLQHLGQMERAAQLRTGEKRVWGPWMWQTDYHLSQAINRANQPSLKQKLSALHEIIRQEMYDGNKLQDWGTAARWAQLLIRETR